MVKRARSLTTGSLSISHDPVKRTKLRTFIPIKVATAEAAAAVDSNPPLSILLRTTPSMTTPETPGQCVIYWMRMGDLRVIDNNALSLASIAAQKANIPLLAIFVISPQDFIAHDRSPRRIDFTLRNLHLIKESLSNLHIPLHVVSHTPRKDIPRFLALLVDSLGCKQIYANIEYEVDELRRDIRFRDYALNKGIRSEFLHNKCVIPPGIIVKKDNTAYAVYSPYEKHWIKFLNQHKDYFCSQPSPVANDVSIRGDKLLGKFFETVIPSEIEGFKLSQHDANRMKELWPAGEPAGAEMLRRFLETKARTSQLGDSNPLNSGLELSPKYSKDRDRADKDTTSRLSVYLSSGVLSARECVRACMRLQGSDQVDDARDSGVGRWIQEIAWRDFYTCILASYPRVSMGRPFLEKFSSVVWEGHQAPADTVVGRSEIGVGGENLERWRSGVTGVPIVDATMRCIAEMGWAHNRLRMITAMFLVKDLMIDWRVGERFFMESLIDGDLASNNGGWQWCASTGVDSCPYFRIFNPYTQSTKADPTGDFIRHWVPELRKLRGPDLHKPPISVADKLGYPRPLVDHSESRDRALRRFKNPGQK